ncbi:MAG: DUF4230 domain-containing protein [Nocardioides sp.]
MPMRRLPMMVGALALVLVLGGVIGWRIGGSGFGFGPETTTVDRSQPPVLQSIQDISEFHAAVGNFEVVLDIEKDVEWLPDFIAGERSLFVAAGTVDAYVDFSGLTEGDVTLSADGTSVEIRLPEAQLAAPNLDQDRTYLFSQERGVIDRLGDAFSTQDQQELYKLAEAKLASAAQNSKLRDQAEDNTRAMLIGMLAALDLTVTFVDDPAG